MHPSTGLNAAPHCRVRGLAHGVGSPFDRGYFEGGVHFLLGEQSVCRAHQKDGHREGSRSQSGAATWPRLAEQSGDAVGRDPPLAATAAWRLAGRYDSNCASARA